MRGAQGRAGVKKIKECCPSILFEYFRCWAYPKRLRSVQLTRCRPGSNLLLHPVRDMTPMATADLSQTEVFRRPEVVITYHMQATVGIHHA